jgi:hypothetical protein
MLADPELAGDRLPRREQVLNRAQLLLGARARIINFYTRSSIDLRLLADEVHQHPNYTPEVLAERGFTAQ